MKTAILIFTGGGLGSLARYGMNLFAGSLGLLSLPLGTFFSNLVSSFILGVVTGLFQENTGQWSFIKPLLVIGFCGGFSTFSAFSAETVELFKNGMTGLALLNIGLNVSLSLLMLFAGLNLVKM